MTYTARLSEPEKDSMDGVTDLLMDISSKLDTQQKDIGELKASTEKVPEGAITSSTNWAHVGSRRVHSLHRADQARTSQLHESPSLEGLSNEVHPRKNSQQSQAAPVTGASSPDETSSDQHEALPTQSHYKLLKSVKLCIADTQVIHHVAWTHELV